MQITSLTICNFRCFGESPVTISLADLSAFVGTNGCGKSAVLQALARMFSVVSDERRIEREDFHVPPGKTLDELKSANLWIEARLEFPELKGGKGGDAVAAVFKHMTIERPKQAPFCRIRLSAEWKSVEGLADGEIQDETFWIATADETFEDRHKHTFRAADRSRVQVLYVPAARDPLRQLRQVSGSVLHRMLAAIDWTASKVKERLESEAAEVNAAFGGEAGVKTIHKALTDNWQQLYSAPVYQQVTLRPTPGRLSEILKRVEATFSPAPPDSYYDLSRLSDGMKSLFYLAIVGSLFDVEAGLANGIAKGIDKDRFGSANLTILAIEEPENHLSPHYLARIMRLLRKVADSDRGQVLLTSHSASIMGRVAPEEVLYLRLEPSTGTTSITPIILPDAADEAQKFIREAVQAHPELYFAKVVVLGEGDSEDIVIPKVARALGLEIDPSFVSFVPLGGRHVNHMWKLLAGLMIPHVTLLDLDVGRAGGGWGRIKYVMDQLIAKGVPRDLLFAANSDDELDDKSFAELPERRVTELKDFDGWARALRKFNVFFSRPLDLDFAMLTKFPNEYHQATDGAPRIPKGVARYGKAEAAAIKQVLGERGDPTGYTAGQKKQFFWYRHLFLSRSKPVTHMLATSEIPPERLRDEVPMVLRLLINKLRDLLDLPPKGEDDAG